MKITHRKKLKPTAEYWRHNDGCRLPDGTATKWVAWAADERSPPDRVFYVYAAGCRYCKQFWGWTNDIQKAARTARAMARHSCPLCEKRLKPKSFRKLQKYLAKRVDR